MDRRSFVLTIALALIPVSGLRGDDRPNILFIFTDDHAAHAMSCYGSVINRTPNLDRIADEGMLFQNSIRKPQKSNQSTRTSVREISGIHWRMLGRQKSFWGMKFYLRYKKGYLFRDLSKLIVFF